MHKSKKIGKGFQHRGGAGKAVVMGMLERSGQVAACVIRERDDKSLQSRVRAYVDKGTSVYTDEWKSYLRLGGQYIHEVINHAERYVDGRVHTNGLENFWSLLKRGLHGTYVSVEPFHLYCTFTNMFATVTNSAWGAGTRFPRSIPCIFDKKAAPLETSVLQLGIT